MKLKEMTWRLLLCANVLIVAGLLITGYSGIINPVYHPYLSLIGFSFPAFLLANAAFVVFWLLVKWKYTVVPVLGMILAYSPVHTYFPINMIDDADFHPDGSIKVLSYNILGYNVKEAPEDEPNPIMQYLIDSDADIICVQEYSAPGNIDSLHNVLREKYQYIDTIHSDGVNKGDDIVGVYSRYPIVSKEHIHMYTKGNSLGVFDLNIDGDTVHVINAHLETVGMSFHQKEQFRDIVHGNTARDSIRSDSKMVLDKLAASASMRGPQADAINAYIRKHKGERIIFCGDINDHPLSYVHRTIAERLTDCYPAAGCGPGFTFHYYSMHVRIDNIMCSEHFVPTTCIVDKSVNLSDHFPIYCCLRPKIGKE